MRRILLLSLMVGACAEPAARPERRGSSPAGPAAACPAGAPTSGYDLWQPGDHCAELDRLWESLPGSARTCATDRDCTVVTGVCFWTAMRVDAVAGYPETPCVHPAGGMCAPGPDQRAACVDGCCALAP